MNVIRGRDLACADQTADCIGETLTLYANGRLLAQVQDDDFETGVVGLLAGTKLVTGFTARFDNYTLFSP